jgi:hypothetical protein
VVILDSLDPSLTTHRAIKAYEESTYFPTDSLAMDEVSCQLHAPTTLAAGKEDRVLNE